MKFTVLAATLTSLTFALEGSLYEWNVSRTKMTRAEAHDYCFDNFRGWLAVMDKENIEDALETLIESQLGEIMVAGEVSKGKKNRKLVPGDNSYPVVVRAHRDESLHVLCQSYISKKKRSSSKKSSAKKAHRRHKKERKGSSSSASNSSSESNDKPSSRF